MSYDIATSASSLLTRNSGTLGRISMGWVRFLEYTQGSYAWFYVGGNADDWAAAMGGYLSTPTGDVIILSQNNVTSSISSGSNTSWLFVCIVETSGVGITAYYRREGATSLSSASVANTSNLDPGVIWLGDNAGRAANHWRLSAYKEWQNTNSLTLTQILAESTQRAPIVTTGLTNYLPCDSGHTVGTDQSAAAQNWTVTGTTI